MFDASSARGQSGLQPEMRGVCLALVLHGRFPVADWIQLQCGNDVVHIDAAVCEAARTRVHWPAFQVASPVPPSLTIIRRHNMEGGLRIEAPMGVCTLRIENELVEVATQNGLWEAELVLRLAWFLSTVRQGGVLIHACGLEWNQQAVVAAGKSGDGKSTLAHLGVSAGLSLLSDEVMQLFPNGYVSGTPFRSDFDAPGKPGVFKAQYFLSLEKAATESVRPQSGLAALSLAATQCQEVGELALPRVETQRRLLSFLERVVPCTFAFRKGPEAGVALRELLSGARTDEVDHTP